MLQAIGSILVTILAVVFLAGMIAGCAASVVVGRALSGR